MNSDALFAYTLANPAGPVFLDFRGTFDKAGLVAFQNQPDGAQVQDIGHVASEAGKKAVEVQRPRERGVEGVAEPVVGRQARVAHGARVADEVGDEPLEMARRLPGVPVVVDASGEAISRLRPMVVVDAIFMPLQRPHPTINHSVVSNRPIAS